MSSRLLLVDDDEDIRTIACITLERLGGWDVLAAASGQEALLLARENGPFDAVLLDVMMPIMDGPSTLAALRADGLSTQVPIVFLTAKAQAAEHQRLLALGGAGVIAKPFDPMVLSNQLHQILERYAHGIA